LTFTLWSRGQLLGESALDFECPIPLVRAGDLHVTDLGLRLLSRVTDARGDALWGAHALEREVVPGGSEQERSRIMEVCADLAASANYHRALELELRRPDGSIVPTERIDVNDTEFLRAFGAACDEEEGFISGEAPGADPPVTVSTWTEEDDVFGELGILDPELQCPGDDSGEPSVPRFQLMVTLWNDAAMP
jgi:hypothetical protein